MPEHVAEETARRVSGPSILTPPRRVVQAVEAGAIATVAVVLGLQLLAPPIVGIANNGDFYRLSPQCGVYYLDRGLPETVDPNFSSTPLSTWHWCSPPLSCSRSCRI